MSDRNDEPSVPAWFAALQGRWRLRRCVLAWAVPDAADARGVASVGGETAASERGAAHDAMPHVEARLRGEVRLVPAESGLALCYEETGVLRLRHGKSLHSKRRYLYRCEHTDAQQHLAIDFADGPSSGLPFVRLPWPALSERDAADGDDLHLCGDDRYRVRYRFETTRGETTKGDDAFSNDAIDRGDKQPVRPGMEAVAWRLIQLSGNETESREHERGMPRWHRIVQRTRVRGPKKDYAIVSILDRIDPAE